jgi:ATP-dependent Lhr-like helicase
LASEAIRLGRAIARTSTKQNPSATDPASPFGAALPWPERTSGEGARPQRATGAQVVVHAGHLLGWVGRTSKSVLTFVAEEEPERSRQAELLAGALAGLVDDGSKRALLITQVDGLQPAQSVLGPYLGEQGFRASSKGYLKRRGTEPHARR